MRDGEVSCRSHLSHGAGAANGGASAARSRRDDITMFAVVLLRYCKAWHVERSLVLMLQEKKSQRILGGKPIEKENHLRVVAAPRFIYAINQGTVSRL